MPAITLENITDAVINHGDKGKSHPRLHEIYASLVKHKVTDTNGKPLVNAIVDVWQPNGEGHYYVQRDYLPDWNFYGRFRTDANGEVHFLTVVPGDYPVPTSGATGSVLEKLGRHGYRACHVHYMIQAEGHEPLTTMMYFNHSPYVDSDTIFSVKNFRVDITKHEDAAEIKAKGLDRAFYTLDYTFVVP